MIYRMNILTIDVEEWFHILDHESTKNIDNWSNYESRIEKNVDRIIEILERSNTKATFFCMGWIAEKYPNIIKKISNKFEIGSHSNIHQLVYEQNETIFKNDLLYSLNLLENLIGKKVTSYRAPGFSITENTKWAFEILVQHGIEIDCSVFPAARAHGGFPSYNAPKPSIIQYNGIQIKELPINYTNLLGKPVIFSGGGYFRLFPYSLIKKWTNESEYIMSYMHPRDFDSSQPIIQDLPLARKFKSYVGLKSAQTKFEKWLQDFEFIDITEANKRIDWEQVPIITL